MDLPSSPSLSSLSLTVSMGKREYQTVGDGKLSFPVLSLGENLIVIVHDSEREEILRTEFRTMLLLERGLCDNLFPLKNGGSLHVKLQFLLSEEDQKRIREMRDSALKKKRMDKPRIEHRRSFSDNRIGDSPRRTSTEIITDGMLLDHSEPTDPGVEPYFGQREVLPASNIGAGGFPRSAVTGEKDASSLKFPQTMSKSFSTGMLSKIRLQRKSKLDQSFFLKETQNAISAMHETLGNKDLKYDEIYKLDIGTEEIKVTKDTSSDVDIPYSAKYNSSMTIDNVPKTIGSGKSTRFVVSAGTSSEIKDFASADVDQGCSTILPIIRNFESVEEKENLNLMKKGGGGIDLNAAFRTFKPRLSSYDSAELGTASSEHSTAGKKRNSRNRIGDGNATSSEADNRKTDTVDVDENNNEEWSLGDKSLPLKKMLDELEKIEHPCQQGSSVEVARTASDENTSQSSSNEQAANAGHSTAGKKRNHRNGSGDGNAISSEGVNRNTETVDINENNNEEQSLRYRSPLKKKVDESEKIERPYQQGSSVEVARIVNDENTSHIPNEEAVPGSSYEKAGALNFGYSSVSPIEILGTWTPRHLCITTGSKLLRDFAESCNVSVETNPIESFSIREADTKQQKDGDAYVHGNESNVLPSSGNSCSENSPSILKSNGGLIEQGVWIIVVIAACGLLFKSR